MHYLVLYYLISCSNSVLSHEFTSFQIEDIPALFSDFKCIEEPSTNFFSDILVKNNNGNDFSYVDEGLKHRNYRSDINELAQFHKIEIIYSVKEENKIFNISLQLGDEFYHGVGKSKKEAKEIAAKLAIENTKYIKPPIKVEDDVNSPPTVQLNNFSAKNGFKVDYYMVDPLAISNRIINLNKLKKNSLLTNSTFWQSEANIDQPPKSPFNVEVYVADQSFYGKGHTIQGAKHDAASKALKSLKGNALENNFCSSKDGDKEKCKEAKNKLKSPISLVYEHSYNKRVNVEFNMINKKGPDHKPTFEIECILGNLKYIGKGKSKKEAKKNAAKMILDNLDLLESNQEDETETLSSSKKKKKKSILEMSKETIGNVFDYFNGNVDDTDSSDKKPKRKLKEKDSNLWSPKEKLIEISSSISLNIELHTSRDKNTGFYTLINLNLNPKYICFGNGPNPQISQEYASLNTLKFLHKLELLENINENELEIERFSFDNFIWLAKDSVSPKE